MSNKDFYQKRCTVIVMNGLLLILSLLIYPSASCLAEDPDWNDQIIYQVKSGDNLISIARMFNLSVQDIVFVNKIEDPDLIHTGRRLLIPLRSKVYVVRAGDNLWNIARKFQTSVEKLVSINKITRPDLIYPGQKLNIPVEDYTVAGRGLVRPLLIWPARGVISSRFGPRWGGFHEGLDIAADIGTPIYAAASGRVIYVGLADGYGKLIKIAHRGEITTCYGHCERILVEKGQFVRQGQLIALMGNTGRSTGTHLHFEVRVKEQPKDPLQWLPWGYLET